jgi:hypothetical protein
VWGQPNIHRGDEEGMLPGATGYYYGYNDSTCYTRRTIWRFANPR